MSQLVQLRQRISTIETIKKITHAMRLIAMSTHSRLRNKQEPLKQYQKTIRALYAQIKTIIPDVHNSAGPTNNNKPNSPELIILIGSQKGLCGTFNHTLFSTFEKEIKTKHEAPVSFIPVGKKAVDYLTLKKKVPCTATFADLTIKTLPGIAQKIISIANDNSFKSVSVISNQFKTFFIQIPEITRLLPVDDSFIQETNSEEKNDYIWEQSPKTVADALAQFYLTSSLEDLLFQSLLAEQAARFISMDSATRNAEQLLEKSTLDYNKLRQAKITKELTEITGSI